MIFGFEFLKPEFKLQILVLLQYISHLYYVHDISVDQVFGLVLIFVAHPPTTWGAQSLGGPFTWPAFEQRNKDRLW